VTFQSALRDPNFLARWPKRAQHSDVETLAKQWPDNVEQFRIAGLAVDGLDQPMMRLLRKIADQKYSSIEDVIVAAIERCLAERELEAKIIPLPK